MVALINFSIVARNPNVIILSLGTMVRRMTKDAGAGETQTQSTGVKVITCNSGRPENHCFEQQILQSGQPAIRIIRPSPGDG